jgi:hypothetical protein
MRDPFVRTVKALVQAFLSVRNAITSPRIPESCVPPESWTVFHSALYQTDYNTKGGLPGKSNAARRLASKRGISRQLEFFPELERGIIEKFTINLGKRRGSGIRHRANSNSLIHPVFRIYVTTRILLFSDKSGGTRRPMPAKTDGESRCSDEV